MDLLLNVLISGFITFYIVFLITILVLSKEITYKLRNWRKNTNSKFYYLYDVFFLNGVIISSIIITATHYILKWIGL